MSYICKSCGVQRAGGNAEFEGPCWKCSELARPTTEQGVLVSITHAPVAGAGTITDTTIGLGMSSPLYAQMAGRTEPTFTVQEWHAVGEGFVLESEFSGFSLRAARLLALLFAGAGAQGRLFAEDDAIDHEEIYGPEGLIRKGPYKATIGAKP